MKIWLMSVIVVVCIAITSCGSPAFMSDQERWAANPTVLEEIRPYLDKWSTSPASSTEVQRKEFGKKLGIGIDIGVNPRSLQNISLHSVKIALSALGDWERGYLYIHEDITLVETTKWEFRQVEDHLYLYNYTY